jgi:hypothetical protein
MNWMTHLVLRKITIVISSSYLQIRETRQENKAYETTRLNPTMCASRRPITNKRKPIMLRMGWCHKRDKNPAPDEGETSSRRRGIYVQGRNYAFARVFPYDRCEYARENTAHTTETSRQARPGHQPVVEHSSCQ